MKEVYAEIRTSHGAAARLERHLKLPQSSVSRLLSGRWQPADSTRRHRIEAEIARWWQAEQKTAAKAAAKAGKAAKATKAAKSKRGKKGTDGQAIGASDPAFFTLSEGMTEQESEDMLLVNEQLTQAAREQWSIFSPLFSDEINTAADVFISPAMRGAREAIYHAARDQTLVALVGESGSGKTTLITDLRERIRESGEPVIIIEPYIIEAARDSSVGSRIKAGQLVEAIIVALDPSARIRRTAQARQRQLHELLKSSRQAGHKALLLIEEAHRLPVATLRAIKSLMELRDGMQRLLGVVLVGQPELSAVLSAKRAEVREIVQRCWVVELRPLEDVQGYVQHKFKRSGIDPATVFDDDAVAAIQERMQVIAHRRAHSICYPLAVQNLITRAMNSCARMGYERVTADAILEC